MEKTSLMTASTTQKFMPQTNIGSLVYGSYRGFPLPKGKTYRPTNISKVNSILGLAMEKQQNLYSFEIYEDALHSHFGNHLDAFDLESHYLRVGLNEYVRLVILTTKTEEEVTAFLMKHYEDFALKLAIKNVADNAVASASELYEFSEHFMIAKPAKKARQMSGNWLKPDEKLVSVEFALTPNIRRS
jgi:hypothetical protein